MFQVIFAFTAFGRTEESPVSVSTQLVCFPTREEAEANINHVANQLRDHNDYLGVTAVRLY
jgi:hypothetical protein